MPAVGTHTVLEEPTLGKGWRWVWLKSREARMAETEDMDHLVGIHHRDFLDGSQAILSLRDAEEESHVTLHLDQNHAREAVGWDYTEVPEQFWEAMDRAEAIVGLRLLVGKDPLSPVPDGMHQMGKDPLRPTPDGMHQTGEMRIWVRDGVLNRQDGPAIEYADGTKEWYRDGKRHREGGPAVEYPNGTKKWYRIGVLHREDGPALEGADGYRGWYRNGRHHREDGPAVEYPDGTQHWLRDGVLHREDGPAIVHPDGTQEWYRNGVRHREDGPAIEHADGTRIWYRDGKVHPEFASQADDLHARMLKRAFLMAKLESRASRESEPEVTPGNVFGRG